MHVSGFYVDTCTVSGISLESKKPYIEIENHHYVHGVVPAPGAPLSTRMAVKRLTNFSSCFFISIYFRLKS